MSSLLAVCALSARILAEAARNSAYRAVALDLFGDRDTRNAVETWFPVGDPARLAIDDAALFDALDRVRRAGAAAWVAGSGFDGRPELLATGASVLPLAGNPPEVVARVRDPRMFYGRLAALGIPHPETRYDCPPSPLGWLRKNAASSGGWDVLAAHLNMAEGERSVLGSAGSASIYYQRSAIGVPMSALFIGDGYRSRLLGINRQSVRPLGTRPYVFHGCIGPVSVAPIVRFSLEAMLDALTADFGLRGLNGLDFLLDGEEIRVIELNPRPPASLALYRDAFSGGLLRAHVEASLYGRLPVIVQVPAMVPLSGFETVFAEWPWEVRAGASNVLARQAWCHDVPPAGTRGDCGDPLCTVSAVGGDVATVEARLLRRRQQIPFLMEQFDDRNSEGARQRAHQCE